MTVAPLAEANEGSGEGAVPCGPRSTCALLPLFVATQTLSPTTGALDFEEKLPK